MPNYEYKCQCGNEFDKLMPMDKRHDVLCSCGEKAQLKISAVGFRIAVPFTVVDSKGNTLQQRQAVNNTPPVGYKLDEHNRVEV